MTNTLTWRLWKSGYLVNEVGEVFSTHSNRKLTARRRRDDGYVTYSLYVDGTPAVVYAHALVLETFVGPRPEGYHACHLDGTRDNNAVTNLMWGTRSDNMHHAVGHGTHCQTRKTHCPAGHPYDEANTRTCTRGDGTTFRQCRTCNREAGQRRDARRRIADAHCESCFNTSGHACESCPCHEPREEE